MRFFLVVACGLLGALPGMSLKQNLIAAGFGLFGATRLHRLSPRFFRGRGVILTFHRIRPADGAGFAPNALLEITPEFLDRVLTMLRENGLEIVTLDEAARRIKTGDGPTFAALTFDDGFRDVVEHGLPVLERHEAPFTFYIAPGVADRTARLWWVELEEAIRRLDKVDLEGDLDIKDFSLSLPTKTDAEKSAAFERVYWLLRAGGEARLLDGVAKLRDRAGVDPQALVASLCLDWPELRALAAHELATFGAHSMTHPRLTLLPEEAARSEITESRDRLERELSKPCRHFAYPYGDPATAGPREFSLAAAAGFATAATTRPGMIFSEHGDHMMALPRLSVNGLWQRDNYFEALLSGAPFAVWNRGRRVNVS
jgi:peptidoglycan/xylan/chitin deacetylase (PgdA/CDA1 family)